MDFAYNNTNNSISNKPILISIEGNIGSGKSTLVKKLEEKFNKKDLKICFLQEPVNEWSEIKDENDITILENYYNNQKKYAFQFQMMAYITRLKTLRDALGAREPCNYDIIITERSVYTDKYVFAKMLFDSNKISKIEYDIYNRWFNEFLKDLPQQHIIYLKTKPSIAFERVKIRARKGEEIPLEYLEECHKYHQNWLKQDKLGPNVPPLIRRLSENHTLLIDGNINIFQNEQHLNDCILNISNFILNIIKADQSKEEYFQAVK